MIHGFRSQAYIQFMCLGNDKSYHIIISLSSHDSGDRGEE